MFKAKLKIILGNDWTKHVITKFNISFKSHYFSHLDETSMVDIIRIPIKKTQHKKILTFLKKEDTISKVDILESKEEQLILKIVTKYESSNKQETNSSIILKNDCFIDSIIEMEKGWEIFTIISHNKKNITHCIKELKKTRKTQLVSLKQYDFEKEDLTQRQYNILKTAYERGFFDFPKKSTTKEIAKNLKIQDSTFITHIKKAEKKIISNFLRK